MNEWIRVKDKLPDDSEIILAINMNLKPKDSGWKVVKYCCFVDGKFVDDAYWEEWCEKKQDFCAVIEATHWMPLPEVPEDI